MEKSLSTTPRQSTISIPTLLTNDDEITTLHGLDQLDIKTGQFSETELNKALKKVKNGKSPGLDGVPPEMWKTKNFNNVLLKFTIKIIQICGQRDVSYPFPKKAILVKRKTIEGLLIPDLNRSQDIQSDASKSNSTIN